MKRFYKQVTTAQADAVSGQTGWQVLLDGRAIKTVGGRAQRVPSAALAQALAQEWAEQPEEIDPARFVLRDMADYALDVVMPDPAAAQAALLPYAETDTLCYRADPDEALYARQQEVWEPVLQAAEARLGVSFVRVSGVLHRPQPAATMARVAQVLAGLDPFALAALRNMASLAASLVVGLAALEPQADIAALWAAASLEEEWQADLWGRDWEAQDRREKRTQAFAASAAFAQMALG